MFQAFALRLKTLAQAFALSLTFSAALVQAAEVIHIYSARHYPSDEQLYQGFTQKTGIEIKRVDADDAGILARLKAEGKNSPADVILLVDASRLWRADQDGLFAPIRSQALEQAIPAAMRAPATAAGETSWFGFSTRARVIVFNKQRYSAKDFADYKHLADPRFKGQLCIRSGSHTYNLSWFGSMMEHEGVEATENWLKSVLANLARKPKGGDTDQIRAVASGECGVAVTNSYYLARILGSGKPEDLSVQELVGVAFPNQQSWGTHVNIAGGAVARFAKNKEAAIRFLEYLATPQAQAHFANGNNEWPVVANTVFDNRALKSMAPQGFKADPMPVHRIGPNQVKVQLMLDRLGFN